MTMGSWFDDELTNLLKIFYFIFSCFVLHIEISDCDMACHKKCEKLTGHLCGLNQKLVAEALQLLKKGEYLRRKII